jgi:cytochrome c
MKKTIPLLAILGMAIILFSCGNKRSGKPKILVFFKTAGYHHNSIAVGKLALMKLGAENGFDVDTTENPAYFNEDSLKQYSAVVFLNTTGDVLNSTQETAFERFIQAGGGYLGIHAASDTEYDWLWYGRLVGAYFTSHPAQQEAKLTVTDQTNPATKHLPKEWKRKDEWYNFKKIDSSIHVLMTIDEKSYEGGKNGDTHPMTWYHEYDGGRAFYTELGHTDESYSEDNYLKLVLGGIQYAIGDNKNLDYAKATSQYAPDEDRFTKTSLVQGTFFEPTEMTILPNLDILVAQRRGELLLYKKSDNSIKQAGLLNVYWKADVPNVNAEEGFMGLKADPNFATNHFIYAYYSPKDSSVNRLSRFKFENDSLILQSEKVVLEVHSQRQICCHTGGSIDFAGDGKTLFVSTGDNSTPFDEPKGQFVNHGYAPLDDRPGHQQYDARRSSGNTNDLRGKILRIRLNDDGSYDIPDGNLFPKGTDKTRPEIYVMGNRNPYRIMVDKKSGYLYWGEVGPDANTDSFDTRGPRGYDEVNQARKAGFFGWPLLIADNKPYHEYDYGTGGTGTLIDPAKPVNNSRNNTGLKELPPGQSAFIWYPYAASHDFPQVGTGGRNAMAGPVYHTDLYPKETRLPDYYNNKLFIYEWIRGWIKVVTMLPNGDFDKMEPFMEHIKLNNLIDMEVGPDGKLYFLEYGSGWFSKNDNAGLSRIDYNAGNRPPQVANLEVNKTSGVLPFTITATIDANDPEKDSLKYVWNLGNNITKETKEPRLEYTFDKAGDYIVSVEVSDDKQATTKSDVINVYAGNEAPTVNIAVMGNKTFYFPGKAVQYAVQIEDKDDTAKTKDLANLIVSADYVEGSDQAGASPGHQVLSEAMTGKNLMLSLDCKTCHKTDEKSIGPAFTEVAKKYQKNPDAPSYLANKIIKGGGGVWGEVAMAAHPDLSETNAKQIVSWIQSLTIPASAKKSLPASGTVQPTLNKPVLDKGVLYLTATYTDKGGTGIKPLIGTTIYTLRNSKLSFGGATNLQGFASTERNGVAMMTVPKTTGSFAIENIDMSGITSGTLNIIWRDPAQFGYVFELHLDAPDGQKIGEFSLPAGGKKPTEKEPWVGTTLSSKLEAVTDGKLHILYIVSKANDPKEPNTVRLTWLQFK